MVFDITIACGCGCTFDASAETFIGNQMLDDEAFFGLYNCPYCKTSRSGPARRVPEVVRDRESGEFISTLRLCGESRVGFALERCECGGLRMTGTAHAHILERVERVA